MERHLRRDNTRIVKVMLHISKEEQRQRLLARIDEPDKIWKVDEADIDERGHWKEYMDSFERCLSATSTDDAPWFIVPADDKLNARLIVADIVVAALDEMKLRFPEATKERRAELDAMRKALEAEAEAPSGKTRNH